VGDVSGIGARHDLAQEDRPVQAFDATSRTMRLLALCRTIVKYCYGRLPVEVQRLADACYEWLRQDSRHPSLHLKKADRFWSVRVRSHYRALAVADGSALVWSGSGSGPTLNPTGSSVTHDRLAGSPGTELRPEKGESSLTGPRKSSRAPFPQPSPFPQPVPFPQP
jgi:hypothetical protein